MRSAKALSSKVSFEKGYEADLWNREEMNKQLRREGGAFQEILLSPGERGKLEKETQDNSAWI